MPRTDPATSSGFTLYGWLLCAWILILPFQYGYHISALNQIQAVLTCNHKDQSPASKNHGLPLCIPMSDFTFSVVTSIFTVGGLIGSVTAGGIMDRFGRKGATRLSAGLTILGGFLMTVASSVGVLMLGRGLIGIGAGLGICVGPIYISEIAPVKIRGSIGVLTQLGIVLGIFLTQLLGLNLATPEKWRWVFLLTSMISFGQLLLSVGMAESPVFLGRKGLVDDQRFVSRRLWGKVVNATDSEREDSLIAAPLLDGEDVEVQPERTTSRVGAVALTVNQLLKAKELRRPLWIVSFAMLSQQVSGINAVLYYSNAILSKALPESGPYVSLGITILNVLMTFPPIFLIEKIGRRPLLQISIAGAFASHILIGLGLNMGVVILSSVAVMTFVTSFAVGLGPVPFVMISEVSPPHAVSALSSVGLSLNWIANFLVGIVFLPLRNILAGGDLLKEGRVFYVFAGVLGAVGLVLMNVYRPMV